MGRREADEHGRPAPNFVMLLHLSLDMDIQMASLEVSTLLAAQTRNCWPAEEEGGPSGCLQTGGQGSCNLPGELLALYSGLYPVTNAAAHCRHVNNPTMMIGAC